MNEKKPGAPAAAKPSSAQQAPKPAEQTAAPSPPKSGKNLKSIFIGILVGVVVLESVIALSAMRAAAPRLPDEFATPRVAAASASGDTNTTRSDGEATSMGATTAESPIEVLVNIAGTDGDRFLKAAVVLEYDDRGAGGGEGKDKHASPFAEAVMQRMPKYKNYLIDRLSQMSLAEINAADAKEKIRKDLLKMVRSTLPPKLGEVRNIYFTQYIIQ